MRRWWKSRWLWWPLAGLVLLVIVFYIEEDIRGALAWQSAKAEIEASGVSLDAKYYIPLPVPDAQNFGALPVFQPSPDTANDGLVGPSSLQKALDPVTKNMPFSKDDVRADAVPYLGKWSKGEVPDLPAIQSGLLKLCQERLPGQTISPTATSVELFEMLCPVLAELRAENALRPECRFEHDYAAKLAMTIPLGSTTAQMILARALSYDERLALMSGDPGLVFDDMKVEWKIDTGLRKEPMLVSGLVASGVDAVQFTVLNEALAKHVFTDQQLAELDGELGKMDDLAELQFVLRGETAFYLIPAIDLYRGHRGILYPGPYIENKLPYLIPDGWFDQYKADVARFHILGSALMVDPDKRRVFPETESAVIAKATGTWATPLWHDFVLHVNGPIQRAVHHFAEGQARLDLARIACRLERYHLAKGQYPDALDALVPAYGADLPHDVMNGENYHYRLNKDGSYVLYSVGWNQKDDGGNSKRDAMNDSPDWVWSNDPKNLAQ